MSRAHVDMRDVVLEEVDGYGAEADPPGRWRLLPRAGRRAAGLRWPGAGESARAAAVAGSATGTSAGPGATVTAPAARATSSADRDLDLDPGSAAGEGLAARRRRWAGAAVVVAVVVGAGALDSWRESTAMAQVAALPESLDPIDGPLRELWRTEDLFLNGFDRVGDLLVGSAYRTGGVVDAIGLDPATGEEVWTTPLSPDGRETGGAQCVTPDTTDRRADAAVTVCVVVDAVGPADDARLTGAMLPSESRLVVLESATGRVLSEEPTTPGTSVAALGADVVLGSLDDDDRLVVRRTDARGERLRWEFTSPEPLSTGDYGRWAYVEVVDGLVVAGGEAGWVLSAEGRPLHAWEPPPHGGGWVDLVGRGLLVRPARGDAATWEVIDVRTSATFEIDGHPVFTPVDDGSAGDILLTQAPGGGLAAYDASDGRRRWSAPGGRSDGGGQLIVDGRVVQAQYDGIGALDAATGAPLWSTPLIPVPQFTLVTDGRLVLCVVLSDAPEQALAAYGLDDGRLRWEVDLPDGLDYLFAVDGSLFGYARSGLVAFG